jgi:hypothetical protein
MDILQGWYEVVDRHAIEKPSFHGRSRDRTGAVGIGSTTFSVVDAVLVKLVVDFGLGSVGSVVDTEISETEQNVSEAFGDLR